ncbi:MAG: ABC transporter permease [Tissierellia bacterium]|nr:ABC transporter permease [Tissierellia bacterium]
MTEKNMNIPNIPKEKFEFLQMEETLSDENIKGEAIGFFKDAMHRFVRNKASFVSFIIIAILVLMAIFGPAMNHYTYEQQDLKAIHMPPKAEALSFMKLFDGTRTREIRETSIQDKYKDSYVDTLGSREIMGVKMVTIRYDAYKQAGLSEDQTFWFGSDSLGRDLWTRLWRGLRISFLISLIAMSVNILVGIVYGAVSGYYGGWVDLIMQRIAEIIGGIPYLVIVILFVFYYGPGIIPIALAMCLTGWINTARMIRGQFFKYKEMEYVLASRTLGASDRTLIFRHILPNAIGIIITMSALAIPSAIFGESFLAYLGLGIQAPESSVGVLLAEGQKVLLEHPHLALFPSITISILMIAFNLMGNGLRDAFDPTLRGIE